jgi:phosphoribosylpyrophosphate synthetase
MGTISTRRFSNENLKVKIQENVREQDVFVVQTAARRRCPRTSSSS